MIKKCPTCGGEFTGHSTQKYCRPLCKRSKSQYTRTCERYERYEREIIDSMTLVQMQRKQIDRLKEYRKAYSAIKDFIRSRPDATIDSVRNMCGL